MKNRIDFYKKGELSTKKFIDDIDALVSWLQSTPDAWVKKMNSAMWEVEIIYAWAQAQNKDLSTEELQQIYKFVDKIEELIFWYEQNCLPSNDDE